MTNKESARIGLRRAKVILEEARGLYSREAWNLVVRRCQEAVELALKSALMWAGIQPPRSHDVGPALRDNADKFPRQFAEAISKLASISRSLRAESDLTFYGDEESGVPPEMLYDREDADEALEKAGFVLERCEKLSEE
ncbi:MAG: DNA-binding protein [Candidatus Latescibacterota bacterium]|nr:MAG: DNA-binding protein [Candidatus Latescibacterota bacterium]